MDQPTKDQNGVTNKLTEGGNGADYRKKSASAKNLRPIRKKSRSSISYKEPPYKFCPWDGYKFIDAEVICPKCNNLRVPHNTKGESEPSMAGEGTRPLWRKILYEIQPYPDNHVDKTFLKSLTHTTQDAYDYWTLVSYGFQINQVFNMMIAFLLAFKGLLEGHIQETFLIKTGSGILAVGYICYFMVLSPTKPQIYTLLSNIKVALILISSLYFLSPVLMTLTRNYANNTIYAISTGLMLTHLIMYDYNFITTKLKVGEVSQLSGSFAVNCAIFAAILLASRLRDSQYVFALLLIGSCLFGLGPFFLKGIRSHSNELIRNCGFGSMAFVLFHFLKFSYLLSGIYLAFSFFVIYATPMILVWMHQYKNEIQGPWDLPNVTSYRVPT
mmetsp:Transcript_16269/g.18315  ORF Transcript_16269/g.18315 Transcript_16269/m.18315 type:complete len:385 (-) Transcript_16269:528-1682(-)